MVYVLVFLAGLLFAAPASAQCIGALQSGNNLSDVCDAATARTSLGLGSIATQASNSISVTGGTATGLTGLGMTSTGAFYGASGTTAERPTATAGGIRFNSTTGLPEYANGSSWTSFGTGGTVTSVSAGAGMDFSTITGTGSVAASGDVRLTELVFFVSGGGSALSSSSCVWNGTSAGSKMCMLDVGFACTIVGAGIKAHPSGSVSFDVAATSYSNFDGGSTHPASGDKISASAPVAVSSSTKNIDTTLTGWSTSISGTVAAPVTVALQVNGSPSTVEEAVVTLYCRRP